MSQTVFPSTIELPPTIERTYLKISATQLDTFGGSRESCNRKWWFSYIAKLPSIQNKSAAFGTAFHSVLERWFKAEDHGPAADLYPKGWDEGLSPVETDIMRRLIALGQAEGLLAREPDRQVESQFLFTLIDEPDLLVEVIGYRDLVSKRRRLVTDHKTTGSGDYAKTNYTLPRTTQMPLYGISLYLELVAAGEPVPEEIFLEHNVFCTAQGAKEKREGRKPRAWKVGPVPIKVKADPRPRSDGRVDCWDTNGSVVCGSCADRYSGVAPTRLPSPQQCSHCGDTVVAEEEDREPSLEDSLDTFTARARAMNEVSKIQTWTAVPGPKNVQAACNAFGGCPYARICGGVETKDEYVLRVNRMNLPAAEQAEAAAGAFVAAVSIIEKTGPTFVWPTTQTLTEGVKTVSMLSLLNAAPKTNGAAAPAAPTPTPPVAQTPPAQAAPTPLPTPGGLAALLKARPPQVNPNPVPAPATTVQANPNQAIMPWATKGCNACTSTGVSTVGNPCMVCDDLAIKDGKPNSDHFIWTFANGIMTAVPKPGTTTLAATLALGNTSPGADVVVPAATAATITPLQAQMAGITQAITELKTVAIVQGTPGPSTVTITPVADPLLASPATTTITAPPPKRRGGRPKKDPNAPAPQQGHVDPATLASGPPDDELSGFTLCIGCRPSRGASTSFDQLWAEAGLMLAKQSGVGSFYDLKPFERADKLVAQATAMADVLHGQTVVAPREVSVEQRGLLGVLRTLAAEVYEA